MQKLKLPLLVLLCFLSLSLILPPECIYYHELKKDLSYEITFYDAKGKMTDKAIYTVDSFESRATSHGALMRVTFHNKKSKPYFSFNFEVKCRNNGVALGAGAFLPAEFAASLEGLHVEADGNDLFLPARSIIGDSLNSGLYVMQLYKDNKSPTLMATMQMEISNRKLVAREEVKIAAGTFDCIKLTYDVKYTTNGIPLYYKMAEWHNKELGLVKSERTSRRGRKEGSSELTKF